MIAGFLRIGSSSALISYDTADFHIEGKAGSWLAYDSIIIDGREFFLMEHTLMGRRERMWFWMRMERSWQIMCFMDLMRR